MTLPEIKQALRQHFKHKNDKAEQARQAAERGKAASNHLELIRQTNELLEKKKREGW